MEIYFWGYIIINICHLALIIYVSRLVKNRKTLSEIKKILPDRYGVPFTFNCRVFMILKKDLGSGKIYDNDKINNKILKLAFDCLIEKDYLNHYCSSYTFYRENDNLKKRLCEYRSIVAQTRPMIYNNRLSKNFMLVETTLCLGQGTHHVLLTL